MTDLTDTVGTSEPLGITYTIKGGAGYDAPWVVLRGATIDELTAQVEALTGVPQAGEDGSGYGSPLEYLAAADVHIKAVFSALGIGKPAEKNWGNKSGNGGGRAQSSGFPATGSSGAPASQPKADETPAHPFQETLNNIADATTQAQINAEYAKNKEAFRDKDVLKAAEEKVNAIKAGKA